MKINFKQIMFVSIIAPHIIFAADTNYEAPENYEQQVAAIEDSAPDFISVQERLNSLSQQLDNFQQQNYIEKINAVQKEVQTLRGIVDMQSHQLEALRQQFAKTDSKPKLAAPSATSLNNAPVDNEASQYNAAFNYLKNRDYDKAVVLFNKFLSQHSDGTYAPNVHYWLGEIYLLQGKYELAESNLATVIATYPSHSKVPDSMLKLAMVYLNTNKLPQAKALVARLGEQYPESTANRMAKMQLGSI